MNNDIDVQFVGGSLDGMEASVLELTPEFHFPRISKESYSVNSIIPICEDVYVRLADTSIYIFKGTIES